jgi:glutamine cyclotransferase
MEINVPFAVQEGQHGVTQNSRETLINMYAEVVQGGRAHVLRRQRPGLESVYAVAGEKRCIERFKGMHYCIIGSAFYSFDGTTLALLGNLASSSGKCWIIYNDNDEILISDGQRGYYWDGATLVEIVPPSGMSGFGSLSYLGGYGIVAVPDSDRFYVTPINDFSQIDELDFATAESAPDPIVRVYADHNELWLAGQTTTEIWQFTGAVDFPFQPLSNAKLERGCAASLSYASEDNTVFFLGNDGIAYRADGYRPLVISSREIEDAIAGVSDEATRNAYSFVYVSRGNKFYVLTFPAELTVVYNITTGLWSRANTYNYDSWRAIGSNGRGSDYLMTPSGIARINHAINKDEGGVMLRKAVSAPGYANGMRLTVDSFFLDAEVGRADIGKDANVMVRVALDGETFGNERVRSLGPTGSYSRRAMWRNLGQGRKPVIEVSVSDDFEFSIIEPTASITVDE